MGRLVNPSLTKQPADLKKIKSWLVGVELFAEYKENLATIKTLEQAENIRAKTVGAIYRYCCDFLSLKGSFEELKLKREEAAKKVLDNFSTKIAAEIRAETGIEFKDLIPEEKGLIASKKKK